MKNKINFVVAGVGFGDIKLLINSVIENPAFSSQTKDTLTTKSNKFGTSYKANTNMVKKLAKPSEPFVVVIGALAKGSVEQDYCEELVSLSNYPLSAATTCAKVLEAFEEEWDIL